MPKISDISINDRFIKALEVPQNTAHKIYWDGKTTGFGVRLTQSGAVSFVLRYVLNGRERKYTIGSYPEHSALSARETAIKLKGEIAKGFDPLEKRENMQPIRTIITNLQQIVWYFDTTQVNLHGSVDPWYHTSTNCVCPESSSC